MSCIAPLNWWIKEITGRLIENNCYLQPYTSQYNTTALQWTVVTSHSTVNKKSHQWTDRSADAFWCKTSSGVDRKRPSFKQVAACVCSCWGFLLHTICEKKVQITNCSRISLLLDVCFSLSTIATFRSAQINHTEKESFENTICFWKADIFEICNVVKLR